jgi:Acyl-CoA thioesterase N-terminal domain/Acyl-CoA thioesterase C-terminal domain
MTETIGRPEMAWTAPDKAITSLDRSWWSWAGPHGGLLASLAVVAAEHTVPEQPVRELSAQFLAVPAEGPVELKIRPLRRGGSSSVLAVTLGGHAHGSGDSSADVAMATTVLLGGSRLSRSVQSVLAPAVPGWERCPTVQLPVEFLPFLQHLDYRPATDTTLLGGRSQAEFIGWLRLHDDSPLNASALTVLVDALPPALYATLTAPVPVPTAAMSVHHRTSSGQACGCTRRVGTGPDHDTRGGRRVMRGRQRPVGTRRAAAGVGPADPPCTPFT